MLELNSKGAGVRLLNIMFLPVYKQKKRFYVQQAVSCGYFLNQEACLWFKRTFVSEGGCIWTQAHFVVLNASRTQSKHGKNVLGKSNSDTSPAAAHRPAKPPCRGQMAQEQGHSWESDKEVTCPNKETAKQSTQEKKNSGPMSPGHLTNVQGCQP